MLIAREISIGGCLFLLFLLGLFVFLNVPLQNILRKLFKGNNKVATIIEVCLFFLVARVLAHWVEPVVRKFLEELTKHMLDVMVDVFEQ